MISQGTGQEALWRAEREAAGDFRNARLRAELERLSRWIRGWLSDSELCCEFLACFDTERKALGKGRVTEREFETVEVHRITGSLGRCSSFDGGFLPICSCSKERWKRVSKAFREGKPLPPVELYRLGDRYFVYDGNHRVSVARYHGAVEVDALVRDFVLDCGCW